MTGGFLRRDPGTFVASFGSWAALNGLSLVLPGDAFELNPIYRELAGIGMADTWWGLAMVVDAAALFATVGRCPLGLRVGVALVSSAFWAFVGLLILVGAARAGLLSAAGGMDVLGAVGLTATGTQWPFTVSERSRRWN